MSAVSRAAPAVSAAGGGRGGAGAARADGPVPAIDRQRLASHRGPMAATRASIWNRRS